MTPALPPGPRPGVSGASAPTGADPRAPDQEADGRRRRGLRRRSALIEAALQVIARAGVAGISHASVAAEAGLPRSAVSHHFASIDDLLIAGLGAGTEKLVADVAAIAHEDDLHWFARELVHQLQENRERIVAGYELYLLAARRPVLREAARPWLDLLYRLAGRHTRDPLRIRAFAACLDGYFLQALALDTAPRSDDLEELLRLALTSTAPSNSLHDDGG